MRSTRTNLQNSTRIPRRKHAFTLPEILVSMVLVLMALGAFFSIHESTSKNIRQSINELELDRLHTLATSELIEALYSNTIPWDTVIGNGNFQTTLREPSDCTVSYMFTCCKTNDLTPPTIAIVAVTTTLTHKEFGKIEKEPLSFCVRRKS